MAKPKELKGTDVDELFAGSGWAKRIAKRNKDWATAKDRYGRSFGQLALERVAAGETIPSAAKKGVPGMVEELAKEGYAWSQEDAIPKYVVIGAMEEKDAKAWILLVGELRKRGVKIGKEQIRKAGKAYEMTTSETLWDFLASEGADDWASILKEAHLLGVEPMDFFDGSALGKMIKSAMAGFGGGAGGFGSEGDDERKQASASARRLERVVKERDLSAKKLEELMLHLSPPQHRLEECGEKAGSNLFEMIEAYQKAPVKRREWFSPNQLIILDAIEEKYGLGKIEPKKASGKKPGARKI